MGRGGDLGSPPTTAFGGMGVLSLMGFMALSQWDEPTYCFSRGRSFQAELLNAILILSMVIPLVIPPPLQR